MHSTAGGFSVETPSWAARRRERRNGGGSCQRIKSCVRIVGGDGRRKESCGKRIVMHSFRLLDRRSSVAIANVIFGEAFWNAISRLGD